MDLMVQRENRIQKHISLIEKLEALLKTYRRLAEEADALNRWDGVPHTVVGPSMVRLERERLSFVNYAKKVIDQMEKLK